MEYSFKDFIAGKIVICHTAEEWPAIRQRCIDAGIVSATRNNLRDSVYNVAPYGQGKLYTVGDRLIGCYSNTDGLPEINFRSLSDFYTPADFFAGRVACKCDTREEYDALMRECERKDVKWCTGNVATAPLSQLEPTPTPPLAILPERFTGPKLKAFYWRKLADVDTDKPLVPFSVLFPSDPWADFMAGKCYIRVTKGEWPELAKMCDAAKVAWPTKAASEDSPWYGGEGTALCFRNPCYGNALDAHCSERDDMPVHPFASIRTPAPEPEKPAFAVGSLYTINDGAGCNFNAGDIVRLDQDDHDGIPWCVRLLDGARHLVAERRLTPYTAPTPKAPEPVKFKVGDIVRGIGGGRYSITTEAMTRGEVVAVDKCGIRVKVLEHKNRKGIGVEYDVDPKYFALVETPAPRAIKIGDTVRFVKKTGIESQTTTAEIGKTYTVEGFSDRGNIRLNVVSCPYVNPEDVELVDGKPETPAPAAPKYKVGDRFKVTEDRPHGSPLNRGEIVTLYRFATDVPTVRASDGCTWYLPFKYMEYMPDVAPNPFPRIEITTDGRVTTATLYEDGKPVKTGTATCSPEDRFDLMEGAVIAFNRLRHGQNTKAPTFESLIRWADEAAALAVKMREGIK